MAQANLNPAEEAVLNDDTYRRLYRQLFLITRSEELVRWQMHTDLTGIDAEEIADADEDIAWADATDEDLREFATELVVGTLRGNRENFVRFASQHNDTADEYRLDFKQPLEDLIDDAVDV